MVSKAIRFFKARNRRERIMLAAVVFGALFAWGWFLVGENSALNSEIDRLTVRKSLAETVIARAPQIEAELDEIGKIFDSSKTVSGVDLQLAVETCARSAGLVYSISASNQKEAGRFKIHTINLSAQKGSLKSYAEFEKSVEALEPYITLSRVSLDGDGKGGVVGRYSISSFELAK